MSWEFVTPEMTMNKTIPYLTIMIALVAGCLGREKQPFTGSGTFETHEIRVSAQSSGELLTVSFEEGDIVRKGQVLAEIDVEGLRLQRTVTADGLDELSWNEKALDRQIEAAQETIKQAEATLDNVKKTRDRLSSLFEQGAATRDRLDNVETEFDVASSRLKAAENQLAGLKAQKGGIGASRKKISASLDLLDYQIGKGSVISPSDGTIIKKFVERGELAAPGTPVCMLADLSTMDLVIYVGEETLGRIKLGAKASIYIDSSPGKPYEGVITWISSEAEFTPKNVQTKESRVDLVYAVKITADNSGGIFKIGMPADAAIEGL